MGQYYHPLSMEKKQFVYSHKYGNGLKLMEHSWIGNNFVNVVENLISKDGDWYGDRIIWAGDYADGEPGILDEESREMNWYSIVSENGQIEPKSKKKEYRYIINMDTKEFVDKTKVPVSDVCDDWEYKIHPLPLLTCEGNGQGGGDYGRENDLIGKWSRQRITVSNRKPGKTYKELIFDLVE